MSACGGQGTAWRSQRSPYTMWIPATELWSSCLVGGAFPCKAILLQQSPPTSLIAAQPGLQGESPQQGRKEFFHTEVDSAWSGSLQQSPGEERVSPGFDIELVVSVNTEEPSRAFHSHLLLTRMLQIRSLVLFSDLLESQVCRAPRRRWSWSIKASGVH